MCSIYNLNCKFNEQLHEVPENSKDISDFIVKKKRKLEAVSDPLERVKILGKVGYYSRVLGKLKDAKNFLNESIELINKHNLGGRFLMVNEIRLAQVYQRMKEYKTAGEMLYKIVDVCEYKKEASDYLNFALQHLGKFHFDIGEYDIALLNFKKALKIRRSIGDKSLIQSTEFAIDITEKNLDKS